MAKFLTELDARCKDDGTWILVCPLAYQSDIIGRVVAPAGFQTDFASVPRVPVAYSLFGNRAHRESVLHDYLYRIDAVPSFISRSQADAVFLEAMTERKKGFFVRYAMWLGVRTGGLSAWHKMMVADPI